jgi:hypothetical protein
MFSYPLEQSQTLDQAFPITRETLPRSKLGYATNNVYPEFPPLMSDGRALIATFQSESDTNAILVRDNGIKSNWQYRKYLAENAGNIIKQNFLAAANDVGYYQRFSPSDVNLDKTYSPPYTYTSYTETSKPPGYSNSDLKDLYLSREQLNSRKVSPSITQYELLKLAKN